MKKLGYIALAAALPLFAFAQGTFEGTRGVQQLAISVIQFINGILVPLIFALAFIVFIWGVFQYFIAGGHDEEKKESGKSLMLYGLIGFFVMVSVWGLVNILVTSFNLNKQQPSVPEAATQNI
ncbi:MAG TPA: pilin [Candidatus Paceibacterota bacterium]|nr:pilin [Candidatus Paceibacterota bacterium]